MSVSELARQAGVARSTVYDHIDDLIDLGVVEVNRETRQGPRYTLDQSGDLGPLLRKLEGVTLRSLLESRDDVDFD